MYGLNVRECLLVFCILRKGVERGRLLGSTLYKGVYWKQGAFAGQDAHLNCLFVCWSVIYIFIFKKRLLSLKHLEKRITGKPLVYIYHQSANSLRVIFTAKARASSVFRDKKSTASSSR